MKNTKKTIIIVACIACVAVIGAAGAYGYFSSRGKEAKPREVVTRVAEFKVDSENSAMLQWKYSDESDDQWRSLVSVEALESAAAEARVEDEIDFRADGTYIQYRDEDGNWVNLMNKEDLAG